MAQVYANGTMVPHNKSIFDVVKIAGSNGTISDQGVAFGGISDPAYSSESNTTLMALTRTIADASLNTSPAVISGISVIVSNGFTRPSDTTQYGVGDLIAANTTNTNVVALQFQIARVNAGSGCVRRARLRKSQNTSTSSDFRIHLYSANPTPTNGDNGVWLTTGSNNYMGSLDVTTSRVFSDGASGTGVPSEGSEITFKLPSGNVCYALMEARGTYSPASGEIFSIQLEVMQD